MLTLIVADRHLVGVVEQDVGGHESRIGEQPAGDEASLALGGLVLELRHPRQLSIGDGTLHHPCQLWMLGNVALDEDRRHLRVDAGSEERGGQGDSALADDAGLLGDGE